MADHALIQASELAVAIMLALLIPWMRSDARRPEFLASVGWHGGGKKKR